MDLCAWISVLLGHAKVNQMDRVFVWETLSANEEIVWLNIPVNEIVVVDSLNEGKHLHRDLNNSFDAKFAPTPVKKILKRWAQQINDKNVVKTLLTKVVRIGDPLDTIKMLVRAVLVPQLRGLCFAGFELDSHGDPVNKVRSLKDDTERPFTNLLTNLVVEANNLIGCIGCGSRWGCLLLLLHWRPCGKHGSGGHVVRSGHGSGGGSGLALGHGVTSNGVVNNRWRVTRRKKMDEAIFLWIRETFAAGGKSTRGRAEATQHAISPSTC